MNENTFTATFGLVPGYFVSQQPDADINNFGSLWQQVLKNEQDVTGIVISVVANESKTIYPVDFGCPLGGETTITVSGVYNPEYFRTYAMLENDKLARWREAVLRVITAMKILLKQSTVTVIFSESRVHYLKD
jgi:hypothetical protein